MVYLACLHVIAQTMVYLAFLHVLAQTMVYLALVDSVKRCISSHVFSTCYT